MSWVEAGKAAQGASVQGEPRTAVDGPAQAWTVLRLRHPALEGLLSVSSAEPIPVCWGVVS